VQPRNCDSASYRLAAAFVDGYHADEIQPYALRAPEVILGCEWGTSADIWNVGCLVCDLNARVIRRRS